MGTRGGQGRGRGEGWVFLLSVVLVGGQAQGRGHATIGLPRAGE